MPNESKEDKKCDSFTWGFVIAPLLIFLIISILLADYLNNFGPWKPAVPIIIGFAVFFFLVGLFLRSKFGRLAL